MRTLTRVCLSVVAALCLSIGATGCSENCCGTSCTAGACTKSACEPGCKGACCKTTSACPAGCNCASCAKA